MKKRTIRRLVLSFVLSAAVGFLVPVNDSHQLARALVQWQRNPTPENKTALDDQIYETQKTNLEIELCVTLGVFLAFNICWVGVSTLKRHIGGAQVSKAGRGLLA